MDSDIKVLKEIETRDGEMKHKRGTNGGCNSAASFQVCAVQWFGEVNGNRLAWMEVLVLFHKWDESLLQFSEGFLENFNAYSVLIRLAKSFFLLENKRERIVDSTGGKLDFSDSGGLRIVSILITKR